MSKITRIEQQKRKKNRVNIYIDGEFFTGLYKDTVLNYHLYEGKEITKSEVSEIEEFERLTEAKEKAKNYLSYRQRSKKEIKDYLSNKGFEESVIKKVLSDFEEAKLVDDHKFAVSWIKDRNKRNPKGKFALKMELRYKGIDEAEIERLLKTVDEKKNARRALQKAIKKYENKDEARKKIFGYLKRRGFNMRIAKEVMKELL